MEGEHAMDEEAAALRRRIDETRSAMTEKIESLKQEVRHTMQDAMTSMTTTVETVKEAVTHTMDTARETVHDTVASVQHAFDLPRHVRQHPWATLVGAVVTGYVLGRLLPRRPMQRLD